MHLEKITVKHWPFKALGIWFSPDNHDTQSLNLTERLKSMVTLINIWKERKLSLKGNVTILRTIILPQVQFLFSMIAISDSILKQLDNICFEYLWDNKPAKIKRNTSIAPIDHGGPAIINVYDIQSAA